MSLSDRPYAMSAARSSTWSRLLCLKLFPLLLVFLSVTGCGTSPGQAEVDKAFVGDPLPINPNISPAQDKITLEVWLDLDFTRDDSLFAEIAKDFEDAYRQAGIEIEVKIQSFVGESIPQKVSQAVLTGTPPNVVQGHVYARRSCACGR